MLRAIGVPELLVIAGVFVFLFGGKKFAELGKGLGESIREFRKAGSEMASAKHEVEKS